MSNRKTARPTAVAWMEYLPDGESLVIRRADSILLDIGDATGFSIDGATDDATLRGLAGRLRYMATEDGETPENTLPTRAALVKYLQGLRKEAAYYAANPGLMRECPECGSDMAAGTGGAHLIGCTRSFGPWVPEGE